MVPAPVRFSSAWFCGRGPSELLSKAGAKNLGPSQFGALLSGVPGIRHRPTVFAMAQTTPYIGAGGVPSMQQQTQSDLWHGTTILTVRKGGLVAVGGDGQVSIGQTIVKANAKKVRKLGKGDVIGGFAGATADALTLFERLGGQLEKNTRPPTPPPGGLAQ